MNLKKLTILHSNDIHGDFLAEMKDGHSVGGIARMSGYIKAQRQAQNNVLYVIAGDMLRGSIIDEEFKGISTMEIINHLEPDIATLGNHEADYGLAHLLFLEKCATFPIITANIYITINGLRLFRSHKIIHINGIKVLFIGIVTDETLANAKKDQLLSKFITIEDAVTEIGLIINSYRGYDIDCTVLVTHMGFLEDQEMAARLDPVWKVDAIIGGHSHTFPQAPAFVNGVLIVQAGCECRAIGRLDLTVNLDSNSLFEYKWQLLEVNEQLCEKDPVVDQLLNHYQDLISEKYDRIITNFDRTLTHPLRQMETEMGNLIADVLSSMIESRGACDLVMVGSGSIRKKEVGPVISLRVLIETLPFSDRIVLANIYGRDLIKGVKYMCRDDILSGHTEFYQMPHYVHIVYDFATKELLTFTIKGQPVDPDRLYTVALQGFHFDNIKMCLDIDPENIPNYTANQIFATSDNDLIQEYFSTHHQMTSKIEGRVTILHRPPQLTN